MIKKCKSVNIKKYVYFVLYLHFYIQFPLRFYLIVPNKLYTVRQHENFISMENYELQNAFLFKRFKRNNVIFRKTFPNIFQPSTF